MNSKKLYIYNFENWTGTWWRHNLFERPWKWSRNYVYIPYRTNNAGKGLFFLLLLTISITIPNSARQVSWVKLDWPLLEVLLPITTMTIYSRSIVVKDDWPLFAVLLPITIMDFIGSSEFSYLYISFDSLYDTWIWSPDSPQHHQSEIS